MTEPTTTFVLGDALTVLRSMPEASVDLVLTSPPFLALRSYLPADHPDKALEMGSEATPGAFLDRLLDVVEECRRVLASHGSLCVELGDTYTAARGYGSPASSNPAYSPERFAERFEGRASRRFKRQDDGWPLDKSLCLIPESFRWTLAYGRNPFSGRETPRWRIRNVIRWCRPNPPVGDLADKFRPATSEMAVACVGRRRYFDLDAVRQPFTGHAGVGTGKRKGQRGANPDDRQPDDLPTRLNTHDGAPPLDWWEPLPDEAELWEQWYDQFGEQLWVIPTAPYPGQHYATWPPTLCVRPIRAMCPHRVCTECGKPSERITEASRLALGAAEPYQKACRKPGTWVQAGPDVGTTYITLGWTDCGHDAWRPGLVCDPFAGSGTTLAVALGHGRSAIGIDLDERNAELARQRVGMFLRVVDSRDPRPVETVPVGAFL